MFFQPPSSRARAQKGRLHGRGCDLPAQALSNERSSPGGPPNRLRGRKAGITQKSTDAGPAPQFSGHATTGSPLPPPPLFGSPPKVFMTTLDTVCPQRLIGEILDHTPFAGIDELRARSVRLRAMSWDQLQLRLSRVLETRRDPRLK